MAAVSHAQAREIVRTAWRLNHEREPTEGELLYAQAIALLETGYGRIGQFGAMAARGQYNWGALEGRRRPDGSCPEGMVPGSDQGAVCFYAFDSDLHAATAFIRTLTKRHWPVVQAMQGSPEDVARAMRVPPAYYAGRSGTENDRVNAYAQGIRNKIREIGANVPTPDGGAGLSASDPQRRALVAAVAVGALAWWYLYRTSGGAGLRSNLAHLTARMGV